MAFEPRTPSQHVQASAFRLRNSRPDEYEELLRALDQYTFGVTLSLTEAGSDEILRAQGRAQEARKVVEMLSDFRDILKAQQPERQEPLAPVIPGVM